MAYQSVRLLSREGGWRSELARRGCFEVSKRSLILAGAPHVRREEVEAQLFGQVQHRRAARSYHLEGRCGDGYGGLPDSDEHERNEDRGRDYDNKHAGAVRGGEANEPLAHTVAQSALVAELEDDAPHKAANQEHVGEACEGRVVVVAVRTDCGEEGEVQRREDDSSKQAEQLVRGREEDDHGRQEELLE